MICTISYKFTFSSQANIKNINKYMLSNLRRFVTSVQQMPVFSQAMELASEKRFDEAEICFSKALQSAASDADAVYILQRLAMVQRTLNKPLAVEETMENVLELTSGPEKELA